MENKNFNVLKPFEPYYHIGLGIWIRSRKQYRDELRARELIEVGNELPRDRNGKVTVKNPHIGREYGR
jgi:hypothetical protein